MRTSHGSDRARGGGGEKGVVGTGGDQRTGTNPRILSTINSEWEISFFVSFTTLYGERDISTLDPLSLSLMHVWMRLAL